MRVGYGWVVGVQWLGVVWVEVRFGGEIVGGGVGGRLRGGCSEFLLGPVACVSVLVF